MLFPASPSATHLQDVLKASAQMQELLEQYAGAMAALPCRVLKLDYVHNWSSKVT
jgi:hypothetical protein